MQITIQDTTFDFHVQYSKRSKLSIEFSPEGLIQVKAPRQTSEAELLDFMKKNSKSLLAFKKKLDSRVYVSNVKSYEETENFLFQGKAYQLTDLLSEIPNSEEETKLALKNFYIKQTKTLVTNRVKHYESIIGVKANSIKVVDSPRSWGTCNSRKELTFNYRLSMAPLGALDYVVIHELCHLLHLNHDRSFWRQVGKYDSSYKAHQDYLAAMGPYMTI